VELKTSVNNWNDNSRYNHRAPETFSRYGSIWVKD